MGRCTILLFCILAIVGVFSLSRSPLAALHQTSLPASRPVSPPLTTEQQEINRINDEAIAVFEQGDFAAAKAKWQTGLEKAKVIGDDLRTARMLGNLGLVADLLGKFPEALDLYQEALQLNKKLPNNDFNISIGLNNVGGVYWSLGQFDKALDFYLRSLAIKTKLDDSKLNVRASLAATLHNLGNVHFSLGQYDVAHQYYEKALKLRRTLPDAEREVAQSLEGLGNLNQKQGYYLFALAFHQQAMEILQKKGTPQELGRILTNMAVDYLEMENPRKAYDLSSQALELREKIGNRQEIAGTLINLGNACDELNRSEEALRHYRRALSLYEETGNRQEMARALNNLGYIYTKSRRFKEAEDAFEQAMLHHESVSEQVWDATRLGDFIDANQGSLYVRYALLCLKRGQPQKALMIADRGRGQGLTRQMAQNQNDFQHILAQVKPKPWKEAYSPIRNLSLRNPDTLYLAWVVGDSKKTLLFALHQGRLSAFELNLGNAKLFQMVDEWRSTITTLSNTRPDLKLAMKEEEMARRLSRVLLTPLEKRHFLRPQQARNIRRLVVVADGPLLDIPFSALLDRQNKRLIDRYAIASSVSLGMLNWPANQRIPQRSMLCVIDPVGQQERFPQFPQATTTRSGLEFHPLPFARMAAEKLLAKKAFLTDAIRLAGTDAQEHQVKKQMSHFAVLHFATHGILNPQEGLKSWLLLVPGGQEDGRLEAQEVARMKLSARMAVLSACETGRGQESGSEGIVGLAWAFRAAGCPALLASHWQVKDEATARLMSQYYEGILAGLPKDIALQKAIANLRKSLGPNASPYYWAAFQIIGDTRSLPSFTKQKQRTRK